MAKPIRPFSLILVLAAMAAALTACGKLTPSTAAMLLEGSDARTYYVHLNTGLHSIQPADEKFHSFGLIDLRTPSTVAGKEETDIVLTSKGQQELRRLGARSCGPGCWEVPLGERTNITVTDLLGMQKSAEKVVFTWDFRPNSIGADFGLGKTSFEGTADFKRAGGKWVLVQVADGAPPP